MSVSIVLRAVKGVPLTNDEVDTNFTNLKVGIEEYTASDVLIKIKTVDGAGSGLDSDLLDGLNAVSVDLVGNSIVSRTAGAFSAGVITATSFIGPVTGNITGNVTGNVTGSAGTVAYGGLTGTPTIWNQSTTGTAAGLSATLAIGSGGTGSTTAAAAKIALNVVTSATGSLVSPSGTTGQRDGAPNAGYIRYNTSTGTFEGYGSAWGSIGGGGGARGGSTDDVFYENSKIITTSYTVTSDKNAMSAGPITINSGAVITVPSGSRWIVM